MLHHQPVTYKGRLTSVAMMKGRNDDYRYEGGKRKVRGKFRERKFLPKRSELSSQKIYFWICQSILYYRITVLTRVREVGGVLTPLLGLCSLIPAL